LVSEDSNSTTDKVGLSSPKWRRFWYKASSGR